VREDAPPPVHQFNPAVPEWLVALIDRLQAKDPAARVASAAELADLLRQHAAAAAQPPAPSPAAGRAPEARPRRDGRRGRWLAMLLGACAVVAAGLALGKVAGWLPGPALTTSGTTGDGDQDRPAAPPPNRAGDRPEEPVASNDASADAPAQDDVPTVYPLALLNFDERGAGAKDLGGKVVGLLFARLSAKSELFLVDREDLGKVLQEQELNLSGAVKPAEATKVGQLTGAKLLVTGSVLHVDKRIYVIAKLIGTETGRVAGASVDGKAGDELGPLVEKLADKLAAVVNKQAGKLVAAPAKPADRVAALNRRLRNARRPAVLVKIEERHVGQATFDPAAETEVTHYCKGSGFPVIDPTEGLKSKAGVVIRGEGISEVGVRHGNLVSVKARLEVTAVDRQTGEILAADRQTVVTIDLTEQIAGKTALQQAAAAVAERLLPRLVRK
jgi:TolB-like protein